MFSLSAAMGAVQRARPRSASGARSCQPTSAAVLLPCEPMPKIIGGEFRSRILSSPAGSDRTRPMTARTKESIFNLLRGWFEDARVLDLFAGIGTMGLEAVSRGARLTVLVERDREVYEHLVANIAALQCGDRAIAILGDALGATVLERAPKPVDVVFLDPPYEFMLDPERRALVLAQASRLRAVMASKGFLLLRAPMHLSPEERSIPGFDGPETHEYGSEMKVMIYMPTAPAVVAHADAGPVGDR